MKFLSMTGCGLRASVPNSGQRGGTLFGKSRVRIGRLSDDRGDILQPRWESAISRIDLRRYQ